MDCTGVRVWLGQRDSEKTDSARYKVLLRDTVNVCRIAKAYSLSVCCECHPNTYNNNTDAFLRIYEDAAQDNLKTYFQSLYKNMEYDYDRIARTLPYTESVHISYSEQRREQFPKRDPSYIDGLLERLIKSGFDGNIFIEYTCPSQRLGLPSSLVKDMARLRERIGEML